MISLHTPSQETLAQCFVDLTAPKHGVEVFIDKRKSRVWINVNGVCLLRICRIPMITGQVFKTTKKINLEEGSDTEVESFWWAGKEENT